MTKTQFDKWMTFRDSGHPEDTLKELELMAESSSETDDKASLLLCEITCHLLLGRVDDAERTLKRVDLLTFQNSDVCLILDYQRACVLVAKGELNQGLQKFDLILNECKRVSQDPKLRHFYEDIQQRRAFALVGLGYPALALPILEECVSFSFDEQKGMELVLLYLGTCYDELGQYNLAKDRFIEVIRHELGNSLETEACFRLAAIHFREGALAQAKLRLEKVVCSFGTIGEPEISRREVYELFSKTCKFLGETDNAERYSELAKT